MDLVVVVVQTFLAGGALLGLALGLAGILVLELVEPVLLGSTVGAEASKALVDDALVLAGVEPVVVSVDLLVEVGAQN